MPLRGLVLIVFFIASVPLCFFRPFYGIVLWVVVAFLNPHSYAWTAFDAFPWATAVAIPTILGMFVFERRFGRMFSREGTLLLLLWLWFTITTLVSTSTPEFAHHAVDTWERWNFVSKILLMTLVMLPIVNTFERLRYFVLTIAGCFAFYVVKAFPFLLATGGIYKLSGPERSMIGDNTDFGLALNMTLPLYFFLAQAETKRWVRYAWGVMFLITIPAIFFTYSRGALVGLAAVFLGMMLQSKRRFSLVPVAILAVVVALALAPAAWQSRMDFTKADVIDNSAQARLNSWAFARSLAADYPVFGGGFATFTEELYSYYSPGLGTVYGAHSVYFQVLAEHGYVGLGLYLLVVLCCLLRSRQLWKAARTHADSVIALYAHMFQFSLVGFLISGFFLGRAYFDYFFALLACVSILDQCAKARWVATTQPADLPGTAPEVVDVTPGRDLTLPGLPLSRSGGR